MAKKYGIEPPSNELGERGKISFAKYKLEKNQEEINKKELILEDKEKNVKLFEAFESNNKDSKAIGFKMVKALEKYNPKLAKAAKNALIKKTKKNIIKK